jgi:hypothetical protein
MGRRVNIHTTSATKIQEIRTSIFPTKSTTTKRITTTNKKQSTTRSLAVSHLEDKEQGKEEQYHVQFDRNVKGGARMAHVPRKRKSAKATVSTTLKRRSCTFLDNDLDIRLNFGNNPNDSVLMGLDSLIAANDNDDVTNPFDFK